MKKEELAEKLDGCNLYKETTCEIVSLAKDNDLVIVHGYSDDGVIFKGVIDEQYGGWDGRSIHVYKDGEIPVEHEEYDNCYRKAQGAEAVEIESKNVGSVDERLGTPINRIDAIWCPDDENGVSWKITSDIPHSTFKVMEDSEVFCIGIVFSINDLK